MHQGSVVGKCWHLKAGWSRLLTGDEMAIFRACRDASRTVDWLHRRAPGFRIDPAMVQTRVVLSGTGAEMAASPVGVSAATGPAGAVDDVALLVAAREARLFAGEACDFGPGSPQAAMLLSGSRRRVGSWRQPTKSILRHRV